MVIRASASQHPPGERLDRWRDVLSDTFVPLDPAPLSANPDPLDWMLRAATLGDVLVAEVEGNGQAVRRPPTLIHKQNPGLLKIGLQIRGVGFVAQDGRSAELGVGDFAVYDTRRPYTVTFPDAFRMLILLCPRSIVKITPSQLADVIARRISASEGIAALISPFLLSLSERVNGTNGSLSDVVGRHLSEAVLELLTASLIEVGSKAAPARFSGPESRLREIHTYIEAHLGRTDLRPESIASAHHMSVRHLQNLFGGHGSTISGWIRSRRLERCRRDLHDERLAGRPVGAIAARWGLADAAYFSRLFRSTYGLTPTEYRRSAGIVAARLVAGDGSR